MSYVIITRKKKEKTPGRENKQTAIIIYKQSRACLLRKMRQESHSYPCCNLLGVKQQQLGRKNEQTRQTVQTQMFSSASSSIVKSRKGWADPNLWSVSTMVLIWDAAVPHSKNCFFFFKEREEKPWINKAKLEANPLYCTVQTTQGCGEFVFFLNEK